MNNQNALRLARAKYLHARFEGMVTRHLGTGHALPCRLSLSAVVYRPTLPGPVHRVRFEHRAHGVLPMYCIHFAHAPHTTRRRQCRLSYGEVSNELPSTSEIHTSRPRHPAA